eukprot:TRINITY_DN3990_c0_g1_i1.p1 TRINITY_DN3990_c0_g1~~TRINITY_DN3990_c0_g1_i1.p1  ORF type:complete len:471 (+),score=78.94 TRINITY_DN3990_c0_g1_i1:412-1824(+)
MFYEDEEEDNNNGIKRVEENNSSGDEDEVELPGSISPMTSRPSTASSGRSTARAAKARQLKEKLRKERGNVMVVQASDTLSRPSSAMGSRPSTTTSITSMSTSPPLSSSPSSSSSFQSYQGSRTSILESATTTSGVSSLTTSTLKTSDIRLSEVDSSQSAQPRTSGVPTHPYTPSGSNTLSNSERELLKRGITPTFDPSANAPRPQRPVIDLTDMHQFVIRPPPKGGMVQCRIVREKGVLYPQYSLYLEENNTFLLAARKRKKSKSSNYLISLSRGATSRDSPNYIGKVRSNFVGTEFVIYDSGDAPREPGPDDIAVPGPPQDPNSVRQELGAVLYSSNILGFKGPRKMNVLIPALKDDMTQVSWKPMTASAGICERYKAGNLANMVPLQNKAPVWNEETQSYVLNFHNRVRQASVKNFQLIHPEDPDYIIMQFGRVGMDAFTMDFQYPMSLVQAFGIALTSFDRKMACE